MDWFFRLDGAGGTDPAVVEARILLGGCDSTRLLYRAELEFTHPSAEAPPPLPAGSYGLLGIARDESCRVVARGCRELELPRDGNAPIEVLMIRAQEPGPCPDALCESGSCRETGERVGGELVLFTFEEGTGQRVRDRSSVMPTMDVLVEDEEAVDWLLGGVRLESATFFASPLADAKVTDACAVSNALTVEVWTRPALDAVTGIAPIVALSRGPFARSTVLAQAEGPDGGFDYRAFTTTTETRTDGLPPLIAAEPGSGPRLVHLVYVRGSTGGEQLYIDAERVAEGERPGTFEGAWSGEARLVLGDEIAGTGGYLGELFLVAIYDRVLTPAEIGQNFTAGPNPELL